MFVGGLQRHQLVNDSATENNGRKTMVLYYRAH
jgi:hypothetical protein